MNKRVVIVLIGAAIIFGVAAVAIYIFVTALNEKDQVYSCVRNRTSDVDVVKLLSSKTPYISPPSNQISENNLADETCQVILAWILVRHGTRYPKKEVIRKTKEKVPFIRDKIVEARAQEKGHLCEEDIEALKEWKWSEINESKAMTLAPQGKFEMENLGRRFRERYPSVFRQNKALLNSSVKFRYTDTERAKASALEFLHGSLELEETITLDASENKDPVLRFYKTCQKWKDTIDDNPASLKEQNEFKNSKHFEGLLQRVTSLTGLALEDLTPETVVLLYGVCSYETAWSGGKTISPWCNIFSELDLQVLEYHQDLDYYWKDGYGNELNLQIACPTLQDLLENLRNKLQNITSDPSLVLYFSHSGLLLKFGALLGLFKDKVSLRDDNFDDLHDRKWRSSYMDKFGTNLAIVVHKCEGSDLKVQLLHQEISIPIPGCTDGQTETHLCPLEKFVSLYNTKLDNCNAEKLCTVKP